MANNPGRKDLVNISNHLQAKRASWGKTALEVKRNARRNTHNYRIFLVDGFSDTSPDGEELACVLKRAHVVGNRIEHHACTVRPLPRRCGTRCVRYSGYDLYLVENIKVTPPKRVRTSAVRPHTTVRSPNEPFFEGNANSHLISRLP